MRRLLSLLALSTVISTAAQVRADTGYYSGNQGTRATGRGGAFVARADDLSAVAFNPAGLSRLKGPMLQVGNRFSYNTHEYARAPTLDWGPQGDAMLGSYVEFETVRNQTPWLALDPFIGFGTKLGLEDWGFALAAYAPAGINRQEFPVRGPQRWMMVSYDAVILNYTASAAWQPSEKFGLGVSLQWVAVPLLEYQLAIDGSPQSEVHPVASNVEVLAKVKGHDYFTFNAILGGWYRPSRSFEIGVSGQVIPSQIKTKGTLEIEKLNPLMEGEPELQRNGRPADDVSLTLPLPLTARGGLRYIHHSKDRELFDLELDVVYESWSRVDRFRLDSNHLDAYLPGQEAIEIGVVDIEKEWRDTISTHLGGDWVAIPSRLTLRTGVYYVSAAAAPRYTKIDFAAGQKLGGALGASVLFGGLEVALAYDYRYQVPITLTEGEGRVYQEVPASPCEPPYNTTPNCDVHYLGQPAPTVNGGKYHAYSHTASLDVLYRF